MRVVPREMSELNPVPECSYCVPGRFLLQENVLTGKYSYRQMFLQENVPEPDVTGALQNNKTNPAPDCRPERTGVRSLSR